MKSIAISSTIISEKSKSHPGVACNYREVNGMFKKFLLVKDPSGLFTPGSSVFGAKDMKRNMLNRVFADGTMFLVDGQSAVVENGKLMRGDEELKLAR